MDKNVNIKPSFIHWGQGAESGELYIGIKKGLSSPSSEDIKLKNLRIYSENEDGQNKVILDINLDDLLSTSQSINKPLTIKFREVSFCQNGQTIYMQILGSEKYTKT